MSKALFKIEEEILKLYHVTKTGKETETAEAARDFLSAMGMELPQSTNVLTEDVAQRIKCSAPDCQNSMRLYDARESCLSEAMTQNLTTSSTAINSLQKLQAHCKNPSRTISTRGYGSTEEAQAPLLQGSNNNQNQNFDLPESIKMGTQCDCPACKFLEAKHEKPIKKVEYCCCCCPIYKGISVEESKQEFLELHKNFEVFLDHNADVLAGIAQI
jgi:hypothetical protein